MPQFELPPGTANYSDDNGEPTTAQWMKLVALLLGVLLVLYLGVVWFVEGLVWLIPPGVEAQLGSLMQSEFELASEDSSVSDELNRLLNQLEENQPADGRMEDRDFEILYVPEDTVNALALPGNKIVIYAGLLETVESENELAMILGHELGHFANRDHLRGLARQLTVQLILAVVIGDPGSLQSLAASGVAVLSNSQFSRQQERQADEYGLEVLATAYGHVAGATDFFERLSENQQLESAIAFVSTHPAPLARSQEIQRLIQERNYRVGNRQPLPKILKVNYSKQI